ncbi:cysteine--tRNA ligase [Desulfallas thermosapovorans]|uniref:Cysteine--tRNA ligase n=1 Tax=Desulfallas thermosapovorans DSM 6562 TaxID=1121431 RepID=A0A5S4ZRL2_9FIRM|nr:cysteine--tRNA ligase [Desulfallas thermosapovorans]TYO94654.1 cysteinyl-tRNA synthetase [Desulfallas thermosapovorans DSM 6562]
MRIYNTLTRKKEEFIPREPGKVAIYVCGPTTYNYIHLGNARPIVVFDTIRRYLKYKEFNVLYVQNFTDIDDKIINRAREEGDDPLALAERYVNEYFKDADALNVLRADIHPKVSGHIPEIIALVEALVDKGFAYLVDGDVYYNVRKFAGYGKLSGRTLEDMQAGARVEVDHRKNDPMDFALWKSAKPGEPAWDSPWGKGRPGWHIECSAMALKYLGINFDIHGGGFDLIFPHHENEIAQTEAVTGQPFARYWVHNGFITVNQEKMSKSLGNFFLVRDILSKFPPEVVRFYLLSTHYRSPLDFDDEKLTASLKGLERIKTCLRLLDEALAGRESTGAAPPDPALAVRLGEIRGEFERAMDDDFNTALAIGTLFDLAREVNSYLSAGDFPNPAERLAALQKARQTFIDFNGVLGIFKTGARGEILLDGDGAGNESLVGDLIDLIIEIRQTARKNKDWPTADRIRDRLKTLGIVLEDTPGGVRWKKQ